MVSMVTSFHGLVYLVQEVEAQQLSLLRDELEAARSAASQCESQYASLRASLVAIHQSLSPQALAAAFSYSEAHLAAFSAGPDEHRAAGGRLMADKWISEQDAEGVAERVGVVQMQHAVW